MLKTNTIIVVALFTLVVAQSCKKEVFDVSEPVIIIEPIDDCFGLFYEVGAKSIVEAKCVTCHQVGGSGPGDYTKKDVLTANLAKIKQRAVEDKTMPLASSPQLTDAEIDILRNWIDCGGEFDPAVGIPAPPAALIYEKDIKSIITAKCVTCHTSGGSGPTDLSKTDEVKAIVNNGRLKVVAIDQKSMPKTGSPQLTTEELDKISKWLNDGAKFE